MRKFRWQSDCCRRLIRRLACQPRNEGAGGILQMRGHGVFFAALAALRGYQQIVLRGYCPAE